MSIPQGGVDGVDVYVPQPDAPLAVTASLAQAIAARRRATPREALSFPGCEIVRAGGGLLQPGGGAAMVARSRDRLPPQEISPL